MTEVVYWVGFNRVSGIGPARLRRLLDFFDHDLERAWHAPPERLATAGLDRRAIDALVETRRRLDLDREMARLERLEVTPLCWDSPDYPAPLRHIPASPPLIYLRGTMTRDDAWALAIVGTRSVTDYGRRATTEFAGRLAAAGLTIVSGLALGVDRIAHEAALEAGGRTIAVLAGGVDRPTPARNRRLAERIVSSGRGALVSDYPIGTRPEPGNFPPRNRIISGLALGTLVIEAPERSGALISAQNALEQGRELFAVPGSLYNPASAGANRLLADGAIPALSPGTILATLDLGLVEPERVVRQVANVSETEARLLALLGPEPEHVDELGRRSALAPAELSGTLSLLELKGLVRRHGAMRYARN